MKHFVHLSASRENFGRASIRIVVSACCIIFHHLFRLPSLRDTLSWARTIGTPNVVSGADVLGAIKSRWMHLTSECYVNGGHLPAGIKRPISANSEKDDAKRARIDLVEEEEKVEANGSDDDEEEDDEFADEFDDAEFVHATAAGQKASDEEHQRVAAAEAREHEREERQKEIERKELEEWSKIKGELIDEERLLAEEDSMWKQIPDPVNCPVKMYANVEVTEMGSNKRSKWNVSADRILLSTPRGEWLASSMEVSRKQPARGASRAPMEMCSSKSFTVRR